MIVVADASPLIFLGKVGKLDLIPRLFKGDILIPEAVKEEVLSPPIPPAEERALSAFLNRCALTKVTRPRRFASAMSRADNEALTLAVRKSADLLLSDERLLREMALIEGIRTVGTLGILLRGMEKSILTRSQARGTVELLIRKHGFRISIEVYEAVLSRITGSSA
jgi:predicted nucleic acid-binding protein